VFGRRRTPETTPTAATPPNGKIGGKGRPTPTRREAEAARAARAKPTRTRREALKRDRAAAREARLRSRQALMSGDERALPARDQGPVRRYVRDFVDSRRTAAEFFFWIAIFVLAGSFIRPVAAYVTLFWMIALIVIVVDSMVLTVRLKSALKRKFPDESLRGTTSYGLLRAMQIRRLRLPPPKVKPGATI
jgi:Flp pilus assembly protein TadB